MIILDVSEYWKKRGPDYYNELRNQPSYAQSRLRNQEKYVINLIKNCKFNKILEIGCGTGRYTKILSSFFNPEKYVALDISKEQIDKAKKYVSDKRIEFYCIRIQEFNYREKFDLVFASEVLMHVDFGDINKVISNMISHSANKIISIDWFDKKEIGKEFGGYCFMHDYKIIFKNNGAKNVQIHSLPLSLTLKLISTYAKLRGRHGIDRQAVIEVDV